MSVPESSRCVICEQDAQVTRLRELADLDSGRRFSLWRCEHCGVLRTLPVPGDLAPHYAGQIGTLMKASNGGLFSAFKSVLMDIERRRLVRFGCRAPFLDLGCGPGDFSLMLHRHGLAAVTADVRAERPILTQDIDAIPYHRWDPERGTIEGLPRLHGATVILRHVLEHVKDPRRLLESLKDQGVASFYIVLPNAASLEARLFGSCWNLWDPPRHLWHFNNRALQTLLQRAGMDVVAQGRDTVPGILQSIYRMLRLRGAPVFVYQWLHPKSELSALSAPINWLLPGNVLWAVGRVRS